MRSSAFVCLALVVSSAACSPTLMVRKGNVSLTEFSLACPRPKIFDATLTVIQNHNLTVSVLEKDSGFIKLERAGLDAKDMDRYTFFPLVEEESGEPIATYAEWSDVYGERVFGSVLLNIILSETSSRGTKVSIRGSWLATVTDATYGTPTQMYAVDSRSMLEDDLRDALLTRCGVAGSDGATKPERQRKLKELLDRGLITKEDFDRKSQALGSP